jgi:3-hydroxybutyryl-CoA dehydratase
MILGKKREIGRQIDQLHVGDSFETKMKIEDKDILLYLGLSDDTNPVYIQHNYAEQTPYHKPVVPHAMLVGLLYSSVNKHLPGPGSVILSSALDYPEVVYHYAEITLSIEIVDLHKDENKVKLFVNMMDQDNRNVLAGTLTVAPPFPLKPIHVNAFENFN